MIDRPFLDYLPEPATPAPSPPGAPPDADVTALVARVAARFGRTAAAVLGRSNSHSVCTARRAVYRELRALSWSYPEIGRLFQRDQSSIRSALLSHPEEAA